ncbi:hypothetical protein AHOG_26735 [Actinoalloteichus hoggarensis]|uniref:Tetratricopeptide repeat protein n=2 Tax=Actinoalloteichus hoggarensis TaxID=1470176 RepID=A0A221WBJ4_9PSEU|nr:hypothetical protein AHOG_26735 [Actinoalloteichus hoggarensis]
MAGQRGKPPATRLAAVRREQGRTQDNVIRMMIGRALRLNISVASENALKVMLSRWENGRDEVASPDYQRLFREVYGRTNEELGFPPMPINEGTEELRDRLLIARNLDTGTLDLFQRQINDLRSADLRFGAVAVLDQLNGHISQIENLRDFTVSTAHRRRLSALITDARTLAGWTALDRGSALQAWRYHEDAKVSAREAEAPHLLAHAAAQQAVILIDLGETAAAVELLEFARDVAGNRVPPLLAAWLAAAHGEGLAAVGRHDDALRAFDQAAATLPDDPADPSLPFLLLDAGNLARWRGSALLRLGDREAIEHLEDAVRELTASPRAAVRGQTGMYVDLAYAHAAAGDRDAALNYARQAKRLAAQIGSDRQRQRLTALELPGTGSTGAA